MLLYIHEDSDTEREREREMGRAPCCDKATVKKGPWSPEEDVKLKSYIKEHGTGGNWIALPKKIGLKRCGKSCRLRWLNYLRPNLKHGAFSEEDDRVICNLYISIGSRWSIIAAQLPGRTDNDIKNYWNTKLKKKLLRKHREALPITICDSTVVDRRKELQTLLSPSAIERIQLHMQLRGLDQPTFPLLWPSAAAAAAAAGHQLLVKVPERGTPSSSTAAAASYTNGTALESLERDHVDILLNGRPDTDRPSLGDDDSNLCTLEAEFHELIYGAKDRCFERDEIASANALDWSQQLALSAWGFAGDLQQQSTIQEYGLPYEDL